MATEFDYAEAWRPEPGDVIKGEVTEVTEYAGGGFGSYPIITIATDDGERAVHCFHTVLRNEMARLDVQPGVPIALLYKGKVDGKDGGASYESYRVKRLDQQGRKFDWADERKAAQDDPTPQDDDDLNRSQRPLGDDDRGEEDVPF